jgi:hypothetical protein
MPDMGKLGVFRVPADLPDEVDRLAAFLDTAL